MPKSDLTRVAVVGSGCGDFAILLARASPRVAVAAFDDDARATEVARRAGAIAGVSDRVTFEVAGDVLGDGYDVVFARIGRP